MAAARTVAIKRLLVDLKEVLDHPQADVAAMPVDDNLLVWHANLRCGDGPLAGLTIHALLLFSDAYPAAGPEVRLFHALPHPNVAVHPAPPEVAHGAAFRVSLWDCNRSLDQWVPAYSVASTLALLSSFLLDPELLYDTTRISLDGAARAAAQLQVKGHPHSGALPCPPFPTAEQIAQAPRLRLVEVRRPPVSRELMTAHQGPTPAPRKAQEDNGSQRCWLQVDCRRRGVKASVAEKAAAALDPGAAARGSAPALGAAQLGRGGAYALLEAMPEGAERMDVVQGVEGTAAAPSEAPDAAPAPAPQQPDSAPRRKALLDPSILRATHRSLIANVKASYASQLQGQRARLTAHSDTIVGAPDHRGPVEQGTSMGPAFDLLTPDALAQVLVRMEARDVAALGATCRGARAACADGEVWRALLHSAFPASCLRCSQLADYRVAYELEANGVVPELSCFYSRTSFETEVLGFAYQYTVNPKTGAVNYVMVTSPDLVCVEAVRAGLVRRDALGNDVQGALPAYVTREHFQRALPLLQPALAQLCPRVYAPGPEQWLTVLPIMLNTCAVLLCDHGTAASERALNTYCGLHRLLLALCEHNGLWDAAERRVRRFLSSEAYRCKAEAPSLGNLMPLLAVSRVHDWRQVLPVVLGEVVDRQVIWACKADGGLAARYRVLPERGGVDRALVEGVFKASAVSVRLLMFHAAFLSLVARPEGQPIGEVMYRLDSLHGRPGAGLRRRFQAEVKQILACASWNEALDVMGLLPLSPAAWTARLRQSWLNSMGKGYHSHRTRFDRIQAGGVSRILLRGQQHSVPPNLARLTVDERWHSCRRGSFAFLDASCLLYGRPQGAPLSTPPELLEVIDYSRRRSRWAREGVPSVRHSGDMIDGDHGQHTLSICLAALPPGVEALYLIISTWAGARLSDIDQPYVCVSDPGTGVELCRFQLEDVPREQRRRHSAVVMLRMYRGMLASRWEIEAVGHVGEGSASDYGPIQEWIEGRYHSGGSRRQ